MDTTGTKAHMAELSHWSATFTEARDISQLTSPGKNMFGYNNATNEDINQQTVASLLDNLTYVSVAHNTMVKSLVVTNQQQVQTIANLTAALSRTIGAG